MEKKVDCLLQKFGNVGMESLYLSTTRKFKIYGKHMLGTIYICFVLFYKFSAIKEFKGMIK